MSAERGVSQDELLAWIEDGTIRSECIQPALKVSGITPDASRWRRFLDHLMLALGSLSLACAVVFLVAYNWSALSHFLQFMFFVFYNTHKTTKSSLEVENVFILMVKTMSYPLLMTRP